MREVEAPSLGELFCEFFKISLLGFGGGVAWAHRIVVVQQRWLTEAEFADLLGICQFMPGPNMIGIAVCVGNKLRGWSGTVAAFCGFAVFPGVAGFGIALLCLERTEAPMFQNALSGVSAAAAGLVIATGLRLLRPHRLRPVTVLLASIAWAGIVIGKFPLLAVLLGLAPLSLFCAVLDRARLQ